MPITIHNLNKLVLRFDIDLKFKYVRVSHNFSFSSRDEIIGMLDTIDNRVEALRKEALKLQEHRDHLLTRIDMLKNTDVLSNLNEADKEEVDLQLKRINERLQVISSAHCAASG